MKWINSQINQAIKPREKKNAREIYLEAIDTAISL